MLINQLSKLNVQTPFLLARRQTFILHNLNVVDDYHGITFVPILLNISEHHEMTTSDNSFVVYEVQFGFEFGVGCTDVTFALRAWRCRAVLRVSS